MDSRTWKRQAPDARENSLRLLRDERLVRFVSVNARERILTLTERGRRLLESHRRGRDGGPPPTLYAGVNRMRELSQDAQLYVACLVYQKPSCRNSSSPSSACASRSYCSASRRNNSAVLGQR